MSKSLDDYVDIRQLHPSYEEKTCWNCGHTWIRKARNAESICSECFQGQGDNPRVDEPTDYGELWYGDIPLEEKRKAYQETVDEVRDLTGNVEVRI